MSDGSARRKSRVKKKEYPVGRPVAPPPGWGPSEPMPVSPPPQPIPTTPPPASWETPPQPPPFPEPMAEYAAPTALPEEPPMAEEPAAMGELLPDAPPEPALPPLSKPIWQPVSRTAEAAEAMTYNLTEPPPGPPTSFGGGPDLLTPPAKIGLGIIGVLLVVGAGIFVFQGGLRPKRELVGTMPDPAVASLDKPDGSNLAPPPVPPAPPVVAKTPDPLPEKKPAPEPEKPAPEPEKPMPEPKKPEPKPVTKLPDPPPTPREDPSLATPIFEKHVLPIFKAKCMACHSGTRKKGGVDVRTVTALVGSGEGDGVLVRGSITKSRLWRAIDSGKMPKAGEKLTDEEKELIRRWIITGAKSTPKTPPPPLPGT